MKEDKYELIWSLILIAIGIILSIIGYMIYPRIVLVLIMGIFFVLYGISNLIKSVK